MKPTTMTAAFLMLITSLGSCVKGDKGDPGPAGTNGTNGTNGSANINAYTITVNPTNWNNAGSGFYYIDAAIAQITTDIVNGGTVSLFKQGNTGVWIGMPYTYNYNSTSALNYNFNYSLGNVRISVQNSSGGDINFTGAEYYKAVIIPPAQKKANPKTDWNNYEEVQSVLLAVSTTGAIQ